MDQQRHILYDYNAADEMWPPEFGLFVSSGYYSLPSCLADLIAPPDPNDGVQVYEDLHYLHAVEPPIRVAVPSPESMHYWAGIGHNNAGVKEVMNRLFPLKEPPRLEYTEAWAYYAYMAEVYRKFNVVAYSGAIL